MILYISAFSLIQIQYYFTVEFAKFRLLMQKHNLKKTMCDKYEIYSFKKILQIKLIQMVLITDFFFVILRIFKLKHSYILGYACLI